jgi:hypothetical protein
VKRIAILQSNYIPWKGYFDIINRVDEFMLYDDIQYTKQDWRNRNRIKTKEGPKWLSIPVSVANLSTPINAVTIADPDWAGNHWKRLLAHYSAARHFQEYRELFENLYLGCTDRHLSRINYRFIKAICEILQIHTRISWSTDYQLEGTRSEKLVSLCRQAGAGEYLSGPAAKAYLDERLFNASNIEVRWIDYTGYPVYRQLFCPPFIHEVSIIDLIFAEGAAGARTHMLSFGGAPVEQPLVPV